LKIKPDSIWRGEASLLNMMKNKSKQRKPIRKNTCWKIENPLKNTHRTASVVDFRKGEIEKNKAKFNRHIADNDAKICQL